MSTEIKLCLKIFIKSGIWFLKYGLVKNKISIFWPIQKYIPNITNSEVRYLMLGVFKQWFIDIIIYYLFK